MSAGITENNGDAGGQVELQIDHVRASRTQTRLTASLGGATVHQDVINVGSASSRQRFAEAVAERAGVDREEVKGRLLEIATELADLYDESEGGESSRAEYLLHTDCVEPERSGIYLDTGDDPVQLTNFLLQVIEDVCVLDDIRGHRMFRCRAVLNGTTSEFTIAAEDFASNTRLPEAIYAAVGAKTIILCKTHVLRTAISAVSKPVPRPVTNNFGWTHEGDAYLVPGGRIDANGFHPAGPDDPIRVDLEGEECARHLDLRPLDPEQVEPLKRHLVDDYRGLLDDRVMYCLLAAVALAVLQRFVRGKNRFSLWLVGLTGGGKSFVAKLAQNFFGEYPLEEGGRVGSWTSTSNFLQHVGYFFRDAIFLIDDYKYEVTRHSDVIKLLHNNADVSARGRLNADTTINVTRPIRGVLIRRARTPPSTPPAPWPTPSSSRSARAQRTRSAAGAAWSGDTCIRA